MVLTTFIKYVLHTIDLQSENPWDNKAVYMLYTELFTGTAFNCSLHCDARMFFSLCCFFRLRVVKCKLIAAILKHFVLISGFIKVLLYIAFMTIMIKVHTFPLFAIRPMYLAMRWAVLWSMLLYFSTWDVFGKDHFIILFYSWFYM